jgi:hypothetical protein
MDDGIESLACPECLGRAEAIDLHGGIAISCPSCGHVSAPVSWGEVENKSRPVDDAPTLDIYHRKRA